MKWFKPARTSLVTWSKTAQPAAVWQKLQNDSTKFETTFLDFLGGVWGKIIFSISSNINIAKGSLLPVLLTEVSFPSSRQSGGCIHLRHHSGRGGPRHHGGMQPGQPEPVRLWPGEAGVLQSGGRLEVGRLLSWHKVWNWILPPLRGCPRD